MEILDFQLESQPLGYTNFNQCPIRLDVTFTHNSAVFYDTVNISNPEIWEQICQYKGTDTPSAFIRFQSNGVELTKIAIRTVNLDQKVNGSGDLHCQLNALIGQNGKCTFGFVEREYLLDKTGVVLMNGIPLASQIQLTIVRKS